MIKDDETDEELYAMALEASKEAKKMLAQYAHLKDPPGLSVIVGPRTREENEAHLTSLQKSKKFIKSQK